MFIAGDTVEKARQIDDLIFYQRKHFHERLQHEVHSRFTDALKAWKATGAAAGQPKPMYLSFLKTVTKEQWESETQEFRDQLRAENDEDFREREAAANSELEATASPIAPTSPLEYDEYVLICMLFSFLLTLRRALNNVAPILQAFAEALEERLGMAVSVLITGPIGAQGGKIGVRRCVVVHNVL